MAALCTGNYGLTQNRTDESKEYFFVKLTDSAFRAVEEYQRNQNKYNTQATIKIIGNGGVLSFPTANGNVGQQFSFSIDEIEGSFECIRQTQNQLDVLGALPYKMRIHANDDVYETTRYRMAVAEENQKNKCTREIKPNQTDIGRKVKLKSSSNRLTNIPPKRDQILTNSSQSPLSSLSTVNPLLGGNTSTLSPISSNGTSSSSTLTTSSSNLPSSGSQNSNSIKNNANSVTANNNFNSHSSSKPHSNYNSTNSNSSTSAGVSAASSLSSVLSTAAGSGTSGINSGYYNNSSSTAGRSGNSLVSGNNTLSGSASRRGTTGVTGSNNRNQKNTSRHMPDITKRKIRERLIHLLALKPFKKPELYTRLQNEGIRERERNLISGILKEISTMRDNTYNLKRQIWNDVNEDWPFYSEQELQMLKRRKPQNLTPPLSSDGGSSTSGQSPTSTHNGSPPPAVKRPSLDRDRFYEEPVAKKQRISHFRKEGNEINRRGGIADSRDSYNMNPRSRDYNHMRSSNYYGDLPAEPITNNWKHMLTPPQPSSNTVFNKHHHETEENCLGLSYSVLGSEAARRISPRDEVMNGHGNVVHHHNSNNNSSSNKNNSSLGIKSNGNACQHSPSSYSSNNNSKINQINDIRRQCSPVTTESNTNSDIGSTSPGAVVRNCSPATETAERERERERERDRENIMNSISQNHDSHSIGGPFTNNKYDFSRFTKIISIEQRRLYKTEFESDYTEYRELLKKIERVGERFKVLAQRLKNARNNEDYRVIKRQILAEYEKINLDQEHQRVKARFDFLHAKLAHIKALVSEFDKTLTSTAASDSVSESFDNPVNRNRTSPSLGNGASINGNLSNGINSSINAASSLSLGSYSISSGSSSLNHLPKQENY